MTSSLSNSGPARTRWGAKRGGGSADPAERARPTGARSEHAEQVHVIKVIRARGVPNLCWTAIPNAGKRSFRTADHLKAEGMRAGAPDLVIFLPPHGRAACLEMKKVKGGVVSDDQRAFAREAIGSGALHAIARGAEEAITILEAWGALRSAEGLRDA